MTLFADQSREQLRAAYRTAWRRRLEGLPLQPLEAQLVAVIELHPEYQPLLAGDAALGQDFGAANPFLHLGLHVALREQVGTDRPPGIAEVHRRLAARLGDLHEAEHRMIEVLARTLEEFQRGGRAPKEDLYLERLRRL